MASNKDLIAEATELAAELNIEITTDDLNNVKLAALVSDLKAKKKDADTVTQADEVVESDKVVKPAFYVAEGKAITSLVGILSGTVEADEKYVEVIEKDLTGEGTLDRLVKLGSVVKS